MAQAVQDFKNFLTTLHNQNLALHEVEEYHYNFYASYQEKDTGNFAFQMLIWKPGASMMGGSTMTRAQCMAMMSAMMQQHNLTRSC